MLSSECVCSWRADVQSGMGKRHGDSLGESEAEAFEAPPPAPKSARLQQPPPPPSHELQQRFVGDPLWPQMQMQSPMQTHSASPPALLPALGRGLQADVGGGVGGAGGRAEAELPPLACAARPPADAPPPVYASLYNGHGLSQEAAHACGGVEAGGGRPSQATCYDRGFATAIEALLSSELELRAQERAAANAAPLPPLTPIRGLSSASRSGSGSGSLSLYPPPPTPPCGCAGCESLVRQPHVLPTPPPTSGSGDGCESHFSSTFTGSSYRVQWFAHRSDTCSAAADMKPESASLQQSDALAGAPVHSPPHSQHSLDDDPHASHQSLLNSLLCDGAASASPAKSDEVEEEAAVVAARASRLPPKLRWRAANRSLQMQQEEEQNAGEIAPVSVARPSGGTRAAPAASDARALCAALDPRLLARTCGAHVRHELRVEREISASASAAGNELLHAKSALICADRVGISVAFVRQTLHATAFVHFSR